MLPSRGILRSGQSLGFFKAVRASNRPSIRQFGTALRSNGASIRGPLSTRLAAGKRLGSPLAATAASHQLLSSLGQVRYASTQPAPAPAPPATAAGSEPLTTPDLTSTPIDLSGSDMLNIPEQIGFLKALGLDYGWGPTSMMQWLLEHVYVYTGLPWWASLVVMAVGVRAAIFKPSLTAAAASQKLQDLRKNPRYTAAMNTMKESMMQGGDRMAAMAARAELSQMNKAVGYSLGKTLWPMINIPLSYGMLRLIRGMAALPVSSMETGGILWFQNLTISDPYFILPIATAGIFLTAFKIPLPYMAPDQAKTMRMMAFILMPLSVLFTIYLPSALQFYFLLTGALQWLQSAAFYNPKMRKFLGLGPIQRMTFGPAKPAASPTTQVLWQSPRSIDTTAQPVQTPASDPNTIFSTVKSTFQSAKEKISDMSEKKDQKAVSQAAREYEERRALEDRERLLARREEKLRKMKRRV